MEIRLAALSDIEPICRLYEEFFAYNATLQPQYYKAAKEGGDYPRGTIQDDASDIFLAVEDGKAVGLIHIREAQTPPFGSVAPHNYAEIIDFITTAERRKRGAGSRLMEAAKQWAKNRKLDYIELFVLSEAKDERRFYENKDFVTVSHTMRCHL